MKKEIKNLTELDIEVLSSTWALKMNRQNLYYKSILREVMSGKRDLDSLPYFVVKALVFLGYDMGALSEMLSTLGKVVKCKGFDEFINNYTELAEEISCATRNGEKEILGLKI